MTSQNLWLRYDRHFVGITWHKCVELRSEDLWCYLNKIHSVFYENVLSLIICVMLSDVKLQYLT